MAENNGKTQALRHTISVMVENRPGVLARVSGLFARRGFNIESLAVSRTEDPTASRMTIVVGGSDKVLSQINAQLYKLIDVIKVYDHTNDRIIERELGLIKVSATAESRPHIMQISSIFRASIVDVSEETMTIEITGSEEKLDSFQSLVESYGILEFVRTGKIALVRGPKIT